MPRDFRQFGQLGESLAVRHLKKNGYRILARNYRNRFGEIDIIARHGKTLVFVEVKARASKNYGPSKAAVDRAKQKKISMVALGYLKQTRNTGAKARFDVVCVDAGTDQPRVEIIPNAFPLAYG
ncbi:MAG: YraN family protein [Desulfobacterales bacterium]|nr:YraN family protein [Desulfobacterales bacterium]MBS3754925.1 YraN family protein [Desulfobacterales bacterium]